MPKSFKSILRNESIEMSTKDIPDFKKASDSEHNLFESVTHPAFFRHPLNKEKCVFLFGPNLHKSEQKVRSLFFILVFYSLCYQKNLFTKQRILISWYFKLKTKDFLY